MALNSANSWFVALPSIFGLVLYFGGFAVNQAVGASRQCARACEGVVVRCVSRIGRMRTGSDDFKDGSAVSDGEPHIFDWLNLPSGAIAVSLWGCLHDGQVVSVRSNLLERTMNLSCEIEHLRTFHKPDEGFQFVLHLEGVQSARLL